MEFPPVLGRAMRAAASARDWELSVLTESSPAVADPRNGSKPARDIVTCMARHGRAEFFAPPFFAPPMLPADVSTYAATEGKFVANRRA